MLAMEPQKKALPLSWVLIFFLAISLCGVKASSSEEHHDKSQEGPVVEKDQRRTLLVTEFGQITAVNIKEDPEKLPYHLQFITLEPNSLFLPVLLHSNMVFYVHTGSGKLTWSNDDDSGTIPLREGDLCSLSEESIFYIQSDLEAERRKLRIYAIFTNTEGNTFNPSVGAYSRINELVKGFDKKIMQAALKAPDDLIEEIMSKRNTPAIVHAVSNKRNIVQELQTSFLKNFLGVGSNSNKLEKYNIFDNDPDFRNRNGWSVAVTKKQLKSLKRTNIGFLMVNLAMGSIMGPHWNQKATEVAVTVEGKGMVRMVCGSGNEDETECQNTSFKVNAGDTFVVPRFRPMAQMSFNDEPFVFLGFSTSAKNNHPKFLAGKGSVLHILDKQILATSLGVSDRTVDEVLRSADDSIIFECSSCAEEEEKIMKEEKEKEEREKKKEEEERKRGEEEEDRKREKEREIEEQEAKRQQEEREKKREEEEEREQEEAGGEKEREREEEREGEQEEAGREKERVREEEEAKRQQEKREKKREKEREIEKEKGERKETEEEAEEEKEEEAEETAAGSEQEKRRKGEEAEAKREQEKREMRRQEEAEKEQEQAKRERKEAEEEEEEAEAKREQEKREMRRQEEAEKEQKQAKREAEAAPAQKEQEQARREQEKREKKRQGEGEMEEGEEDDPTWWERVRREKGKRPEEEEVAEGEQEQAKRQQEEREKRREQEGDDDQIERQAEEHSHRRSFEGRRVLKVRNV